METRVQKAVNSAITGIVDLMTDKNADKLDAMIPDNVIVVTGATGGTGASTIINSVAYTLSKNNIRVCVVDLNIMNPIQHIYFGYKKENMQYDLIDYLSGSCQLGYAMNVGACADLITPINRSLSDYVRVDSEEYAKKVSELLEKLKRLYNIVIVDVPLRLESMICNEVIYKSNDKYLVLDESLSSYSALIMLDRSMRMCGINPKLFHCIINKKTSINIPKSLVSKFDIDLCTVLPYIGGIVQSGFNGEIFIKDGVTSSKNVKAFCNGIDNLCAYILEHAGITKVMEVTEEIEDNNNKKKKDKKKKKGKKEENIEVDEQLNESENESIDNNDSKEAVESENTSLLDKTLSESLTDSESNDKNSNG